MDVAVLLGLCAAHFAAQTVLTNDSIIRMAKAGLSEEIFLTCQVSTGQVCDRT